MLGDIDDGNLYHPHGTQMFDVKKPFFNIRSRCGTMSPLYRQLGSRNNDTATIRTFYKTCGTATSKSRAHTRQTRHKRQLRCRLLQWRFPVNISMGEENSLLGVVPRWGRSVSSQHDKEISMLHLPSVFGCYLFWLFSFMPTTFLSHLSILLIFLLIRREEEFLWWRTSFLSITTAVFNENHYPVASWRWSLEAFLISKWLQSRNNLYFTDFVVFTPRRRQGQYIKPVHSDNITFDDGGLTYAISLSPHQRWHVHDMFMIS